MGVKPKRLGRQQVSGGLKVRLWWHADEVRVTTPRHVTEQVGDELAFWRIHSRTPLFKTWQLGRLDQLVLDDVLSRCKTGLV